MKYENRNGKAYYLYEGKTKTGKPRYFFSAKDSNDKGTLVDAIPEGYEIYEKPENAQVFLRKKRPRLITELEERFVKKQLDQQHPIGHYLIDCNDEYLTIYESARSNMHQFEEDGPSFGFESQLNNILGKLRSELNVTTGISSRKNPYGGHYTAVLRFCLSDKETRVFAAERYCFRGAIDDWMFIDGPDGFQSLVTKYIKHLGTDQFYELPYLTVSN